MKGRQKTWQLIWASLLPQFSNSKIKEENGTFKSLACKYKLYLYISSLTLFHHWKPKLICTLVKTLVCFIVCFVFVGRCCFHTSFSRHNLEKQFIERVLALCKFHYCKFHYCDFQKDP